MHISAGGTVTLQGCKSAEQAEKQMTILKNAVHACKEEAQIAIASVTTTMEGQSGTNSTVSIRDSEIIDELHRLYPNATDIADEYPSIGTKAAWERFHVLNDAWMESDFEDNDGTLDGEPSEHWSDVDKVKTVMILPTHDEDEQVIERLKGKYPDFPNCSTLGLSTQDAFILRFYGI